MRIWFLYSGIVVKMTNKFLSIRLCPMALYKIASTVLPASVLHPSSSVLTLGHDKIPFLITGEAAKRKRLDWPTRLSIALGAARGK